jgi:hypothetical protein
MALPRRTDSAPARQAEIGALIDRLKARRAPNSHGHGRLIFALDATASREATWDRAAMVQAAMFDETAAIGALDVRLVFFRDTAECKASPWYASASTLHGAMRGVRCLAGGTQIKRVLRHALDEAARQPIAALIFVGDAMEEIGAELVDLAGRLGDAGTAVFIFQEGNDAIAASAFREMARVSGGAHLPFDLASIGQLRDLLGAVAVYATGDRAALAAYGKAKGGPVLQLTSRLREGTP